jgi:serine/threonine-protein kinase
MGDAGDRAIADADTITLPADEVRLVAAPPGAEGERYQSLGTLGQGGMGVVSLLLDRRIGRRVAAKSLRADVERDEASRARFLREAQVQGQLEHPAIVPVYDLATAPDGAPLFTMKTVKGVTLREILDDLRAGTPEAAQRWTRHRLLTAFASVCLAVDYAHQRGILHRDLKPANLMLGDFGEVYVLDWGLAKLRGTPDTGVAAAPSDTPQPTAMTHVGALLGTPGFMAPEQIDDASDVGPAADVYALGAILFEIVSLVPLHPRGSVREAFESTRQGADARPSVRAPDRDPPPELDAVCVAATALDPAVRTPSARALHDAVQRYLEGERDLELRRDKSREHARLAAEAAVAARAGGSGMLDARRRAMQEIGRALALDPGNVEAVGTMVTLLTEAPRETPPEVGFELEKNFRRQSRWIGGVGAVVYFGMLAFIPLMLWMGVRQPLVVGSFFLLMLVSAALSVGVARSKVPPVGAILTSMLCSTAAFGLLARFGSPVVLAPMALAVNATAYAIYLERRYRSIVAVATCLAFLVPLALERAGVLAPTFTFEGDAFVVWPRAVGLPESATLALLTVASVAALILGTLVVGNIRDRLADAERRIYLYAWHLRELVPPDARRATDPTAP